MNNKLSKLDKLELMQLNLGGDMGKMQTHMQSMSSNLAKVKIDLDKQSKKWEAELGAVSKKVASLEKGCHKLENYWNK